MNTKAITNIQRQASVLSDGHQEVVDQAVAATAAIIALDDRLEESRQGAGISLHTCRAQTQMDKLQAQLRAQSLRALRVYDEVEQIKKNLKIV